MAAGQNPYTYSGRGQGFLTDYSNLSAAGSAFQGFAQAYQNAQDQQMKKNEQLAQIESLKAKTQRDYEQSNIDAASKGFSIDPSTHQVSEAPLGPRERTANQLKAITGGARESGLTDEAGNPQYEPNPDFWKATNAQLGQEKKDRAFGVQQQRLALQGKRFEETQNQNAASAGNKLESDPLIQDMTNARYNLSRGKNLLTGSTPLTYNNLNAVQQDVINGMTKGGQSSEGKVSREMQESWAGRYNNLLAKAGQYGPNNDIRKQDPGLAKQIGDLLNEVDSTIGENIADRKSRLASSYSQSTNPKVQAVVKQKLSEPTNPGGLISKGLIKPGMVTQPSYDPDVLKYAEKFKISPEEAQRIKDERSK